MQGTAALGMLKYNKDYTANNMQSIYTVYIVRENTVTKTLNSLFNFLKTVLN